MRIRLLLSGLVLLALATVGPRLDQAYTQPEHTDVVHLVVRADEVLAPVNPLLFGQNHGLWMNTNDLFPNSLDDLAALADALDAEVSVQVRTFSHTFPPHSVTLFVLDPTPWGGWLLWAGLGLAIVALIALGALARRKRRMR